MPTMRPAGSKSILALLAIALLACAGDERLAGDGSEPRVYSTRGLVRRMPDAAVSAGRELWIHHEAIPDFVDLEGRVVGMEAMTMPFTVADGVDLGGLEPGDKISFLLEVDWEGSPPSQITEIRELDPATRLDLD